LCQGTVLSLFGAAGKTAADWKQNILIGLRCRAFAVAGRQRVDGVEAIRLTGHKALTGVTIWADPRSYLPVRLTVPEDVVTGSSSKVSAVTMRIDFRWLPPTSADLAKLTAPIPPGFREVAGPAPAQGAGRAQAAGQRLRVTTHSTWWVIGNASNARSASTRQPPAISRPRSRARVAGSQET
jgi:hypothetical protein